MQWRRYKISYLRLYLPFFSLPTIFPSHFLLPLFPSFLVEREEEENPLSQSFAAVGPVLNATIACQEIPSILSQCNPYLVSKLNQNFVLISKNYRYCSRHQRTQTLRHCRKTFSTKLAD